MGRILSITFLAATLLMVGSRASFAQESLPKSPTHGTGIGVGVQGMLLPGGPSGLSIAYDGGPWHAEGLLGIYKPPVGKAGVDVGGNFWFHLHKTANADFSVGGGLGLAAGPSTVFYIQAGGQIRAFLTSNVALSATLGLAFSVIDADQIGLGGQSLGTTSLGSFTGGGFAGAGLHYYFY
jgi:hypothetical protein